MAACGGWAHAHYPCGASALDGHAGAVAQGGHGEVGPAQGAALAQKGACGAGPNAVKADGDLASGAITEGTRRWAPGGWGGGA